jgi:hypothetical protein
MMTHIERFLVDLDRAPWSAIYRIAVGLSIPPIFRALSVNTDHVLVSLLAFVGLLIVLRLVPVVLRRVLPFSAKAKGIWAVRRHTAKQFDSYQWQKLFWFGVGLLPWAFLGNGWTKGELAIALVCLTGGLGGLLIWHGRHGGRLSEMA